jgi:hypothetical protein
MLGHAVNPADAIDVDVEEDEVDHSMDDLHGTNEEVAVTTTGASQLHREESRQQDSMATEDDSVAMDTDNEFVDAHLNRRSSRVTSEPNEESGLF